MLRINETTWRNCVRIEKNQKMCHTWCGTGYCDVVVSKSTTCGCWWERTLKQSINVFWPDSQGNTWWWTRSSLSFRRAGIAFDWKQSQWVKTCVWDKAESPQEEVNSSKEERTGWHNAFQLSLHSHWQSQASANETQRSVCWSMPFGWLHPVECMRWVCECVQESP